MTQRFVADRRSTLVDEPSSMRCGDSTKSRGNPALENCSVPVALHRWISCAWSRDPLGRTKYLSPGITPV
jgi:hypothetical protein